MPNCGWVQPVFLTYRAIHFSHREHSIGLMTNLNLLLLLEKNDLKCISEVSELVTKFSPLKKAVNNFSFNPKTKMYETV